MSKPIKILIVRFSSIGDIVLTSPVIRCLKTQINTELHFLTKYQYHSLLINNQYLDKIYYLDNGNIKDEGKLSDLLNKYPLLQENNEQN